MSVEKQALRQRCLAMRSQITNKQEKDDSIAERLNLFAPYVAAKRVLIYVATATEIETRAIIEAALQQGKEVGVPRCLDKHGRMVFHRLSSLSELSVGAFGVEEPSAQAPIITADAETIMIVPALSFDKYGYRLGYGKGYYDRYLKNFAFISVGLCYNTFIHEKLPTDMYDEPVSFIVTESEIIACQNGGKNGKLEF